MNAPLTQLDGTAGARRHFRYFDYLMAAFVAILLLSNLIGASKLATLGGYTFGAGILFFPLSYVLGDVLTEVYGYANARRCVWTGFVALVFMAFMSFVVVAMPPAAGWDGQAAYESVFGSTWRIVVASVLAFWAGEFVNSFVLAKLKILTRGRWLWTRTIGSTIVGEGLDSLIFYPIALTSWVPLLKALGVTNQSVLHAMGGWQADTAIKIIIFNWSFKVIFEIVMTPVTYAVCNFLKRAEKEDFYDTDTNFTPFSLKD